MDAVLSSINGLSLARMPMARICRRRSSAVSTVRSGKSGDEPYYPVNDAKNGALYEKYKELAEKEDKVIFGGRLGEYKYYDMDAVIASALELVKKEL